MAAALVGLAALTAIAVHLFSAAEARHLLGFTFPGLPRRLTESEAIFLNNARVLAAILVACGVVQVTVQPSRVATDRALALAVRTVCDVVIGLGCLFNVLMVGSSLGAYGARALATMLPHGPFELGAFSLALSLYLAARRGALTRRRYAVTAGLAVAALAVGAVLEVFGK